MKKLTERNHSKPFRRGGLETLIAVIVLIALVVGGLVYTATYYGGVAGGASQQVNVQLQGSVIKVNAVDGSGSVYLKMYNEGPGGARLTSINITVTKNGVSQYIIVFTNNVVAPIRLVGSTYVALAGVSGLLSAPPGGGMANNYLALPPATTTTILMTHQAGSGADSAIWYFDPGATYVMRLCFVQAPTIDTTIPSVSSP